MQSIGILRPPKTNKRLKFDFAIFNKNKELILLIEYDGIQHFQEVGFFGGQDELKIRQYRDEIKNNYCLNNQIPLVRIPYYEEDNIESILKNNDILKTL
ncbi:DUF2726 domain-containing protein [Macrococcus carouselicus]|uniref:DUF2726 domain-containing protein n=1 Tax=Macrococcus carouselicus TaxID=69969 RepID=A0A9Q8CIX9_9STAP|nr:DUF2726 domain-containing protein [Macrococcus carouselicus]TDM04049.1 DUF2726 domain-containing protein [Macrococcus carouselicus]